MATVATVNELGSYTHNPRGNLWYNDESSYGKKMLLKMGWKKGKGLGKKEDGIKENLKVKFRSSNSGLGFKDDFYNAIMKTEYESILKNLRSEYPQQKVDNKNTGHENQDFKQRSRIVKSKIRYPKLYYAKDVSRYSEKDMKSIFICSLPFKDEKEESIDSGKCLKEESPNSGLCLTEDSKNSKLCMKEEPKNPPETYTSHLSISDYFNKKMKEKKGIDQKKNYASEVKQETDTSYTEEAMRNPSGKKHKKKRKMVEMNTSDEDCKIVFSVMEKDGKDATHPKKKHKKSAEKSGHEITLTEGSMQEESNLTVDQSVSHKKHKKHKRHKESSNYIYTEELPSDQCNKESDVVPPKKKKKSHTNEKISSDAIELLSVTSLKDDMSTNSLPNNLPVACSAPATGEILENIDNNLVKKEEKKFKNKYDSIKNLKSCLKSKKKEYVVKNVSFNENVSCQFIDCNDESTGNTSDCGDKKISTDSERTESANNTELPKDCVLNKTEIEVIDLEKQNETSSCNTPQTVSKQINQFHSIDWLPSPKSRYYNSWVEKQKQLLKLTVYKAFLHGIEKHDILKTTNLLFIKGYGNWGLE